MIKTKCKICQDIFEAETRREKYCSDECRKKGQYLVKRKWELENPEAIKKIRDRYRKNNPEKIKEYNRKRIDRGYFREYYKKKKKS